MNDLPSSGERLVWPVRVYYEDTDSGGVVYYANYLRYLERGRTEWLRALGFEQTYLATELKVVFVVRALTIDYLRPALFNDELQITVEPGLPGASQIIFAQQVLRGPEVLCTAQVRVACINLPAMKPVRIPGPLITIIREKIRIKTT